MRLIILAESDLIRKNGKFIKSVFTIPLRSISTNTLLEANKQDFFHFL